MLIIQSLQWRTPNADIPPRPRGNQDGAPPWASLDIPCGSCTTTQTLQQTSAAVCAPDSLPQYSQLTDRQHQVQLHQPDSWKLTHSLYSLTGILSQTSIAVFQPCYIYRSPFTHLSTYMTQSPDPMVQHTPQPEDCTIQAKDTAFPS